MAMPSQIEQQCIRLGLGEQWRKTIESYIRQFGSITYSVEVARDHDDTSIGFEDDQVSPEVLIHDALVQINPDTDDRTKRRLFGKAIAKLPVFYQRCKVSVEGKEQFWDPLKEDIPTFLQRTGSSERDLRRYTAQTLLLGEDIIASRVFSDLVAQTD